MNAQALQLLISVGGITLMVGLCAILFGRGACAVDLEVGHGLLGADSRHLEELDVDRRSDGGE